VTYETVAGFTQSLSLILFFTLFIGVVAYAVWPGNSRKFEQASRMPLDTDEHNETATRDIGGRN